MITYYHRHHHYHQSDELEGPQHASEPDAGENENGWMRLLILRGVSSSRVCPQREVV